MPALDKLAVQKLVKDIFYVLNPGGLLYLSTIAGDYEQSGFKKSSAGDDVFMYFYDIPFLTTVLERNRFTLLNTESIDSNGPGGTTVIDLAFVVQK